MGLDPSRRRQWLRGCERIKSEGGLRTEMLQAWKYRPGPYRDIPIQTRGLFLVGVSDFSRVIPWLSHDIAPMEVKRGSAQNWQHGPATVS